MPLPPFHLEASELRLVCPLGKHHFEDVALKYLPDLYNLRALVDGQGDVTRSDTNGHAHGWIAEEICRGLGAWDVRVALQNDIVKFWHARNQIGACLTVRPAFGLSIEICLATLTRSPTRT
jgi:hypothetical protein